MFKYQACHLNAKSRENKRVSQAHSRLLQHSGTERTMTSASRSRPQIEFRVMVPGLPERAGILIQTYTHRIRGLLTYGYLWPALLHCTCTSEHRCSYLTIGNLYHQIKSQTSSSPHMRHNPIVPVSLLTAKPLHSRWLLLTRPYHIL